MNCCSIHLTLQRQRRGCGVTIEQEWEEELAERYVKARAEQPEFEWIEKEPPDRSPVVDCDGRVWVWQDGDEDEDDDDYAQSWVRQCWTLMGKDGRYMSGPPIGAEWDYDVLDYAPIRKATPDDDLSIKYLYYPDGWENGAPQGEPVLLRTPFVPAEYLEA